MTIFLYEHDIPDNLEFPNGVAVDTETLGLNPLRDRVCVVQLSSGDGNAHLVQIREGQYDAPNLRKLIGDTSVTKIFHYARFDMAIFKHYFDVEAMPVFCTKIASKLTRTYTNRHGLKDVVSELAGVALDKQQQSSDWAAEDLSEAQQNYAASDVLYLHKVKAGLEERLEREGREALAQGCFDFLPTQIELDLNGWADDNIFSHS